MQTGAAPEDLDLDELIRGRVFQALRQARRKSEGAAVGQFNDDAVDRAIIARCRGVRLREAGCVAAGAGWAGDTSTEVRNSLLIRDYDAAGTPFTVYRIGVELLTWIDPVSTIRRF